MGRTMGALTARLLLALIALSIFAPSLPGGEPPAISPSASTSPESRDSDVAPRGAHAPSPVDSDFTAKPAYPSGPEVAEGGGPLPTLVNAIANHHFDDAYALGYRGTGVRVAVVDEGIDFGHPDLSGAQAIAPPGSPYAGWPIAYDPKSLTSYLQTGSPDNTLFANTTLTGGGPFDVAHAIRVDGTNDFALRCVSARPGSCEQVGADPRDGNSGDPGGDKSDFDLTDLFATRDAQSWYFGLSTWLRSGNASFVLLIDVDNGTSGAQVAPGGFRVDTNTSHADRVNDVAWSPDGSMVASVAGDRLVRTWDRTGRLLHTMGPHANEPMSVKWSPDGTKVASADKEHLFLWDVTTGTRLWNVQYVPFGDPSIVEGRILSFSPNGTWVAASTSKYVHFFDVAAGTKFGTMWPNPTATEVNAVAFNPANGTQLAVGLGSNQVGVYAINGTNVKPNTPSTRAIPLYLLSAHTAPVWDVAWSPDGSRLVSGSKDTTVALWNTTSQTLIRPPMPDHQSDVLAAAWATDGQSLVTSSLGLAPSIPGSLALWDRDGNLLRIVNQTGSVFGVDFSVNMEVVTGGGDLTVRTWTAQGEGIALFVAHRPDYAIQARGFSRWSDRENTYAHGVELATWHAWNVTRGTWESVGLQNVSGRQAAFQFGDLLFAEFSVPRSLIGDPGAISVSAFSAGDNASHAQDTTPRDNNVDFPGTEWSPTWTSLSAFAYRRIESYRVQGLTSASGVFHFGFHPAPAVQQIFGALGVLVADPVSPGTYDRVFLDMNDDKVFDASDVVVSKAGPIATIDLRTSSGPGTDGYADISAGMTYFISDGVNPIPYSGRLAARKEAQGLQVRIPGAGDLVAFAGEFGVDPISAAPSQHGTRVASAVGARGRVLSGTANGTQIIPVMNGMNDPVEAWTFAIEGYDGAVGTGDEAQVVVSAFNFPTLHHDGWDAFSRTADYLSTHVSGGRATFVASSGDTGFGYGTVLSPASAPSVIAAGRAGDFSLRSSLNGGTEGPNPQSTNPAMPGSRGPSAQGFAKPEILAVDTATVDTPLHSAPDGTSAYSSAAMVGSDVSAAIVAGAVAIVYEAFNATQGRHPSVYEVRAILMSGADDTGHDVLTQGAGFLNVSRSVKLASRATDAGLEVVPSTWHPGGYRNQSRDAFTNLLFPGDADAVSLSLRNRGSSTITASVDAVAFTRIGGYSHTNVTLRDAYEPGGDIALWVNDTGVWKVDGSTFATVPVAPPIPGVWGSAELVKVTAFSDLSRLVYKIDSAYFTNYSYTLKAYDWTIDWANWGGPIGPFPAPAVIPGELNTIAETFHRSNSLEVRASFPATAIHDGLVVSLEAAGAPLEGLSWTFLIEFYDRAPWPWVTVSSPSVLVFPSGLRTVTATVNVPSNADLGAYEGAILIRDPARGTTTVPVVVNVGARGPKLALGGNATSDALFDNHRLFGGYDRTLSGTTRLLRPTLGDWRFFFFEIPDQGIYETPVGYKMLVRTLWTAAPSDLDTFDFNPAPKDAPSENDEASYGPFSLRQVAKSEEIDKPEFRTVSGGAEEVVAYDLASGLNVIAIRGFALRGLEAAARLSGVAGWVNTPTGIDVATQALAGGTPVSFLSNLDLPALRASAVGPAQTTAFTDLPIAQDVKSWWNFGPWGDWMQRGSFTYIFDVRKALILEVAIQGKTDVSDLDLAVFRNAFGAACEWDPALEDPLTGLPGYWKTCELDPMEYNTIDPSVWKYDADGDADERVKWTLPGDGQFIVKVLGFTVLANPGHFDFQIAVTLDTGTGYQVPEAPKPSEIVNGTGGGLAAFTRVSMTMTWDFPSATTDDRYGGAVLMGLPNAPGVVVVPAAVLIDRGAPQITGIRLNPLNGQLDRVDNRTTNDPSPFLVVSVEDPDWGQLASSSVSLVLDGTNVTSTAIINIGYLTRNNRLGLWEGTLTLVPPALSEGSHTLVTSIADRAGNPATASFVFREDRTAPTLTLDSSTVYTRLDTYSIGGSTDPGASVRVRGTWYPVDPSGTFAISVPLLNGSNAFPITAADWFDLDPAGNPEPGNTVTATKTVVQDLTPPQFTRVAADPTGPTRRDETVVTGSVLDYSSPSEKTPLQTLRVRVGGQDASIQADGSFRVSLPLQEGPNAIAFTVEDAAGNQAATSLTVTRDSTSPTITLTTRPASVVESRVVTIAGTTESNAFVSVNGIAVPAPGGVFSTTVDLSPGTNQIVVQARDLAGNVNETRLTVTVGGGGSSPALVGGVLAVGVLVGAVVAFLMIRMGFRIPGLSRRPKVDDELMEEEPASEPSALEPPKEETAPDAGEDPRVLELRKEWEEGRITREVFEERLRRLEGRP